MSVERRIAVGACLLCVGVLVGCVQAWLAVTGRAPVMSGLSLLALGLGGLGAVLMIMAGDGPAPADVGAAAVPYGPAGGGGAAASAPTPETAREDTDHEDGGVEEVLAAAARIVDRAVEHETDAAAERIYAVPHAHLRMVLTPGGQATTVTDGTGADDAEGGDGVPGMVCELVAPSGWMGSALMTLADALISPRRVREMLTQLAREGDASAVAAAEYLRLDLPGGEL
ncbi:hypothetical protein [Actinomyces qiguomingii]|uniref:hypothetical protein n=1 Tax=Actinomyces qiguomingii TaxID=2057800 RepID=UPI000CA04A70|nr:hypothetical protein [Actinomyces qiguomingii]